MQTVSSIIKKCFGYNNSLFSGSMDIIVIKQPSGKLRATPLRLRFSNYAVFKAGRKKVTVKVNGKIVDIPMYLQKNGIAFVLSENKNYKKEVEEGLNDNSINENNDKLNKTFSQKNIQRSAISLSPSKGKHNIQNQSSSENSIVEEDDKNSINKNENSFIENDKNDEEIIHNLKPINIGNENNVENNNTNIIKLEISDCWENISRNKLAKNFNFQQEFEKNLIDKEEFFKDPWKVIKNPNLAIKYNNQILTTKVIIPMMFSQLVYGCPLPEEVLNNLTESQYGLFFWRTKHKDAFRIDLDQLSSISGENENNDKKLTDISTNINSLEDEKDINIISSTLSVDKKHNRSKTVKKQGKRKYRMKKSSKITSFYLEKFELNEGVNDIEFIVDNSSIHSNIYLWNYNDKIVISDFDGTITRSDVFGQIGVYFGIDWTHKYIAKLYSHIVNNGYKILYVTARTMYLQNSTKNSLKYINQNGFIMPPGPMMMNDSGLIDSIKTEIIDKTPEEFKIDCLAKILKLFPKNEDPFYCGIGNKPSDRFAYEKVGINPAKIYIINEKGEVSTYNSFNCKTNFLLMDEKVNELFPYVFDNGYNSIFYPENIVYRYKPEIKNLVNQEEIEKDISDLLAE